MSSKGFRNVPGVPEGWKLVRVGKPNVGDWFIDGIDDPRQARDSDHCYGCAIISKIEKPAKYRPFANAKEAHPFWDASLRLAGVTGDAKDSRFRITSIGRDGITTNAESYSYEAAFYKFYVDDDGTPFGVRVDES
jgi:hypothetical protein